MNKILICPAGHRFPVNMEKHQDDSYVMCPRCGTKITIRKSLRNWKPSAQWAKQKTDREDTKKQMKAMGKKHSSIHSPTSAPLQRHGSEPQDVARILLMLRAMQHRKKEPEPEQVKS